MILRHPRPRANPVMVKPQQQRQDIAVITCHFNWNGFIRPTQNLHRFLRDMEASGIEVYGVETQLEGVPFATEKVPNWIQIRANEDNVLFQKEALLNLAASLPPDRYTKLAWVDADLRFYNPNWLSDTSVLLDDYASVQPFGMAWWTAKDGTIERGKPPSATLGMDNRWLGHPGFAWAAQRTLWSEVGGLYSRTPVGHGDTIYASSVIGSDFIKPDGSYHGIGVNTALFFDWRKKLTDWSNTKVSFTPGHVYHEWHGEIKDRKYAERSSIVDRIFDHEKHLKIDEQGLLSWTHGTPASMKQQVLEYFKNRKEDG